MEIKKMSKKAQKTYYNSKRGSWYNVNPITKVGKGSHDYKVKKAMMKGV